MTETVLTILWALARVLIGLVVVMIAVPLLGRWLERLSSKTRSDADDILVHHLLRTIRPLGVLAAMLWGWTYLVNRIEALQVEGIADRLIEAGITLLAMVLLIRLINRLLMLVLDRFLRRTGTEEHITLLYGLEPMIRTVVWVTGTLIFLQNQGVALGAIYASLAGAGIGIGLALKGPIVNFINYLTIMFDEPFKIGQFIRFDDDFLGVVERVGIRSSAIRSLSGERIVISNEDLLSKTIRNFGDLPRRRVATTIGVVYQTPADTVTRIPRLVEEVIRANPPAEFDRCHFTRFADSALEFEFVFFVPDADIVLALDLQQAINLGIMRCFEEKGIDFAYPTQTLFVQKGAASAVSLPHSEHSHAADAAA
jgi:small-conductance mechanosensitive channel